MNLYGVFCGSKWCLATNAKNAVRFARHLRRQGMEAVVRVFRDAGPDYRSFDATTFWTLSDPHWPKER